MNPLEQAQAHFEAAEYRRSREVAVEALRRDPSDVSLLRIAGRAGVELASPDAVDQLRRVVELRPDDAEGWRDLGDALAAEGNKDEATAAFRRAVELDPSDDVALSHLGYSASASDKADAASYLHRAAERTRWQSSAAIGLVDLYRGMGQLDAALEAATRVAEAEPHDPLAALDVAELNLELGRFDDALRAYERLREIGELPDDEAYALHGMIRLELARGDLGRALELAREAEAIAGHGRTGAVVAFLEAEQSGAADDDVPTRADIDLVLASFAREHRRLLEEDRRLSAEDRLG